LGCHGERLVDARVDCRFDDGLTVGAIDVHCEQAPLPVDQGAIEEPPTIGRPETDPVHPLGGQDRLD
jgi:hypothetical protein